MKERVQNEAVPVQQTFQEEQSIFVKKNGQLENVASNFPQYPEIKSGLYKNKNKKIQSWYKSQMIPCVYALLTQKT